MKKDGKTSFMKRNSLTLVFITMGIGVLVGQAITGWREHNEYLREEAHFTIDFISYLGSGHFLQATFENLESEFLQMALFVLFTVFLYQKGSSESNPLPEEKKEKKTRPVTKDSPWPARVGGVALRIYENSLFIILIGIFIVFFFLHAYGSLQDYNTEAVIKGESLLKFWQYLGHSKFWFESFQNWQSEFISIAAIVLFSVFLRQKGSSQSKEVNTPNTETED
jgi:hypothetical protein